MSVKTLARRVKKPSTFQITLAWAAGATQAKASFWWGYTRASKVQWHRGRLEAAHITYPANVGQCVRLLIVYALSRANPHHAFHIGHENSPVANLPGVRNSIDRVHDSLSRILRNHGF
jgi:hypothetical protein